MSNENWRNQNQQNQQNQQNEQNEQNQSGNQNRRPARDSGIPLREERKDIIDHSIQHTQTRPEEDED